MGSAWLTLILSVAACAAMMAMPFWLIEHREGVWSVVAGAGKRLDPRHPLPRPAGRPIELIADDARRLGLRMHHLPRGTSYAKQEGIRRAYDGVLAEGCAALGVEHLLAVLPPGVELDAERRRVEYLLDRAGLSLDEVA